jgi:hypothetical protein
VRPRSEEAQLLGPRDQKVFWHAAIAGRPLEPLGERVEHELRLAPVSEQSVGQVRVEDELDNIGRLQIKKLPAAPFQDRWEPLRRSERLYSILSSVSAEPSAGQDALTISSDDANHSRLV